MWTQRDQLQAYQFLRRRLVSALQVADANHPVSPSRRVIACGIIGAVVMLLIAAGFGIYGLLRPGANTDWRKPGQVVIEKESGTPYVLLNDGRLHPAINYTSARLLAGGNGTATAQVSAKSLRNAPRGALVGIPGAPEAPPATTALVAGPWTVCAETSPDRPAATAATTIVTVGVRKAGAVLKPTQALVVRHARNLYAIVDGRRLKVADEATLRVLRLDEVAPAAVTEAWLSAVPEGPRLQLIRVPDAGQPGPRVGQTETKVGQVLVVADVGAAPRYYVVLRDGVAPARQTEAMLVLGNPLNKAAHPVKVGASDINDLADGLKATKFEQAGYPPRLPEPGPTKAAICATAAAGGTAVIHVADSVPMPAGGRRMDLAGGGDDPRIADEAYVPPGRGAIVREQRPSGAVVADVYLVTDQGIRFPVADRESLKALGFERVRPVGVPATMLALLPAGPTLDRRSAAATVDSGDGDDRAAQDGTAGR